MLGFGDKHGHSVDPSTLPVFVHALHSDEAFALATKIWQANARYLLLDPSNAKELLRFAFNDPACVVWLERDQGRTDTFELILLWEATGGKQSITEIYVIGKANGTPAGNDERVKNLLNTVLVSPAIVPVNQPPVGVQKK